jgi:hypothetical protein
MRTLSNLASLRGGRTKQVALRRKYVFFLTQSPQFVRKDHEGFFPTVIARRYDEAICSFQPSLRGGRTKQVALRRKYVFFLTQSPQNCSQRSRRFFSNRHCEEVRRSNLFFPTVIARRYDEAICSFQPSLRGGTTKQSVLSNRHCEEVRRSNLFFPTVIARRYDEAICSFQPSLRGGTTKQSVSSS